MRPSAQNLTTRPFTNPHTMRNSEHMLVQQSEYPSAALDHKLNSANSQPVSAPNLNYREGTIRTRLNRKANGVWALDDTRGFFQQSAVDVLQQKNLKGNESSRFSLFAE